jgi:hypothetical protein
MGVVGDSAARMARSRGRSRSLIWCPLVDLLVPHGILTEPTDRPKEKPVSGRGLPRHALVVLVMAASLTACGGGEAAPPDATPSSSSPSSSSPATDDHATDDHGDDDGAAITVTREGDTFTPNGERVELEVGQTLTLTIDADAPGELHVHSTPEQEITYGEGTSEHEITIDRPGVVEVESHEPDTIVLQLEVR